MRSAPIPFTIHCGGKRYRHLHIFPKISVICRQWCMWKVLWYLAGSGHPFQFEKGECHVIPLGAQSHFAVELTFKLTVYNTRLHK